MTEETVTGHVHPLPRLLGLETPGKLQPALSTTTMKSSSLTFEADKSSLYPATDSDSVSLSVTQCHGQERSFGVESLMKKISEYNIITKNVVCPDVGMPGLTDGVEMGLEEPQEAREASPGRDQKPLESARTPIVPLLPSTNSPPLPSPAQPSDREVTGRPCDVVQPEGRPELQDAEPRQQSTPVAHTVQDTNNTDTALTSHEDDDCIDSIPSPINSVLIDILRKTPVVLLKRLTPDVINAYRACSPKTSNLHKRKVKSSIDDRHRHDEKSRRHSMKARRWRHQDKASPLASLREKSEKWNKRTGSHHSHDKPTSSLRLDENKNRELGHRLSKSGHSKVPHRSTKHAPMSYTSHSPGALKLKLVSRNKSSWSPDERNRHSRSGKSQQEPGVDGWESCPDVIFDCGAQNSAVMEPVVSSTASVSDAGDVDSRLTASRVCPLELVTIPDNFLCVPLNQPSLAWSGQKTPGHTVPSSAAANCHVLPLTQPTAAPRAAHPSTADALLPSPSSRLSLSDHSLRSDPASHVRAAFTCGLKDPALCSSSLCVHHTAGLTLSSSAHLVLDEGGGDMHSPQARCVITGIEKTSPAFVIPHQEQKVVIESDLAAMQSYYYSALQSAHTALHSPLSCSSLSVSRHGTPPTALPTLRAHTEPLQIQVPDIPLCWSSQAHLPNTGILMVNPSVTRCLPTKHSPPREKTLFRSVSESGEETKTVQFQDVELSLLDVDTVDCYPTEDDTPPNLEIAPDRQDSSPFKRSNKTDTGQDGSSKAMDLDLGLTEEELLLQEFESEEMMGRVKIMDNEGEDEVFDIVNDRDEPLPHDAFLHGLALIRTTDLPAYGGSKSPQPPRLVNMQVFSPALTHDKMHRKGRDTDDSDATLPYPRDERKRRPQPVRKRRKRKRARQTKVKMTSSPDADDSPPELPVINKTTIVVSKGMRPSSSKLIDIPVLTKANKTGERLGQGKKSVNRHPLFKQRQQALTRRPKDVVKPLPFKSFTPLSVTKPPASAAAHVTSTASPAKDNQPLPYPSSKSSESDSSPIETLTKSCNKSAPDSPSSPARVAVKPSLAMVPSAKTTIAIDPLVARTHAKTVRTPKTARIRSDSAKRKRKPSRDKMADKKQTKTGESFVGTRLTDESDADDLPTILPPKRRRQPSSITSANSRGTKSKLEAAEKAASAREAVRVKRAMQESLMEASGLERIMMEFPKHNWLQNKIMQRNSYSGGQAVTTTTTTTTTPASADPKAGSFPRRSESCDAPVRDRTEKNEPHKPRHSLPSLSPSDSSPRKVNEPCSEAERQGNGSQGQRENEGQTVSSGEVVREAWALMTPSTTSAPPSMMLTSKPPTEQAPRASSAPALNSTATLSLNTTPVHGATTSQTHAHTHSVSDTNIQTSDANNVALCHVTSFSAAPYTESHAITSDVRLNATLTTASNVVTSYLPSDVSVVTASVHLESASVTRTSSDVTPVDVGDKTGDGSSVSHAGGHRVLERVGSADSVLGVGSGRDVPQQGSCKTKRPSNLFNSQNVSKKPVSNCAQSLVTPSPLAPAMSGNILVPVSLTPVNPLVPQHSQVYQITTHLPFASTPQFNPVHQITPASQVSAVPQLGTLAQIHGVTPINAIPQLNPVPQMNTQPAAIPMPQLTAMPHSSVPSQPGQMPHVGAMVPVGGMVTQISPAPRPMPIVSSRPRATRPVHSRPRITFPENCTMTQMYRAMYPRGAMRRTRPGLSQPTRTSPAPASSQLVQQAQHFVPIQPKPPIEPVPILLSSHVISDDEDNGGYSAGLSPYDDSANSPADLSPGRLHIDINAISPTPDNQGETSPSPLPPRLTGEGVQELNADKTSSAATPEPISAGSKELGHEQTLRTESVAEPSLSSSFTTDSAKFTDDDSAMMGSSTTIDAPSQAVPNPLFRSRSSGSLLGGKQAQGAAHESGEGNGRRASASGRRNSWEQMHRQLYEDEELQVTLIEMGSSGPDIFRSETSSSNTSSTIAASTTTAPSPPASTSVAYSPAAVAKPTAPPLIRSTLSVSHPQFLVSDTYRFNHSSSSLPPPPSLIHTPSSPSPPPVSSSMSSSSSSSQWGKGGEATSSPGNGESGLPLDLCTKKTEMLGGSRARTNLPVQLVLPQVQSRPGTATTSTTPSTPTTTTITTTTMNTLTTPTHGTQQSEILTDTKRILKAISESSTNAAGRDVPVENSPGSLNGSLQRSEASMETAPEEKKVSVDQSVGGHGGVQDSVCGVVQTSVKLEAGCGTYLDRGHEAHLTAGGAGPTTTACSLETSPQQSSDPSSQQHQGVVAATSSPQSSPRSTDSGDEEQIRSQLKELEQLAARKEQEREQLLMLHKRKAEMLTNMENKKRRTTTPTTTTTTTASTSNQNVTTAANTTSTSSMNACATKTATASSSREEPCSSERSLVEQMAVLQQLMMTALSNLPTAGFEDAAGILRRSVELATGSATSTSLLNNTASTAGDTSSNDTQRGQAASRDSSSVDTCVEASSTKPANATARIDVLDLSVCASIDTLPSEEGHPVDQRTNQASVKQPQISCPLNLRPSEASKDRAQDKKAVLPAHQAPRDATCPPNATPPPVPVSVFSPYDRRNTPLNEPPSKGAKVAQGHVPKFAHSQPPFQPAGSLIVPAVSVASEAVSETAPARSRSQGEEAGASREKQRSAERPRSLDNKGGVIDLTSEHEDRGTTWRERRASSGARDMAAARSRAVHPGVNVPVSLPSRQPEPPNGPSIVLTDPPAERHSPVPAGTRFLHPGHGAPARLPLVPGHHARPRHPGKTLLQARCGADQNLVRFPHYVDQPPNQPELRRPFPGNTDPQNLGLAVGQPPVAPGRPEMHTMDVHANYQSAPRFLPPVSSSLEPTVVVRNPMDDSPVSRQSSRLVAGMLGSLENPRLSPHEPVLKRPRQTAGPHGALQPSDSGSVLGQQHIAYMLQHAQQQSLQPQHLHRPPHSQPVTVSTMLHRPPNPSSHAVSPGAHHPPARPAPFSPGAPRAGLSSPGVPHSGASGSGALPPSMSQPSVLPPRLSPGAAHVGPGHGGLTHPTLAHRGLVHSGMPPSSMASPGLSPSGDARQALQNLARWGPPHVSPGQASAYYGPHGGGREELSSSGPQAGVLGVPGPTQHLRPQDMDNVARPMQQMQNGGIPPYFPPPAAPTDSPNRPRPGGGGGPYSSPSLPYPHLSAHPLSHNPSGQPSPQDITFLEEVPSSTLRRPVPHPQLQPHQQRMQQHHRPVQSPQQQQQSQQQLQSQQQFQSPQQHQSSLQSQQAQLRHLTPSQHRQIHQHALTQQQSTQKLPQPQPQGAGAQSGVRKKQEGMCALCGAGAMYLCSMCRSIWYCSQQCQTSHWRTHSSVCKPKT